MKLRASYGESTRAPTLGLGDAQKFSNFQVLANPQLAPERQRGTDGGIEVYLGGASLGVTYYNQRAIDLLQRITVPTAPPPQPAFQWQNIARVQNEGWELEGRVTVGPARVQGTYSITTATVQQLPANYPAGGYRVGDRILGIPHTSAGATVTYSPLPQTTLTGSMTLIGHWTEHDWVALYGYFYGNDSYRGSDRAYWIEYPTITKFAVGVSQDLRKGLTAFMRVDNVGNSLRYEQNNAQVPRTRSVTVGVNMRY